MERQVFHTVEDVVETGLVSRSQAYKLVKEGVLPSIRIGRSVRIPADAFRRWVDARMNPGKSEAA